MNTVHGGQLIILTTRLAIRTGWFMHNTSTDLTDLRPSWFITDITIRLHTTDHATIQITIEAEETMAVAQVEDKTTAIIVTQILMEDKTHRIIRIGTPILPEGHH